jgi:hypothetical protein
MSNATPAIWPWPPTLDAMTAAPACHDLLFENEHVRVLDAHLGPGETVPVHTHCWPGVRYILNVSDLVLATQPGTCCSTPAARNMPLRAPWSGDRP